MEVPDIARNILSWLDDSSLQKLYLCYLIPSLSSIVQDQNWWHARVESLTGFRTSSSSEVDWKQTYRLLVRELESNSVLELWNIEDNDVIPKLLYTMNRVPHDGIGNRPNENALLNAARHGSLKILRCLLDEGKSDPLIGEDRWLDVPLNLAVKGVHLTAVRMLLDDPRSIVSSDHLSDACCTTDESKIDNQVKIVRCLLQDKRVVPSHKHLYPCTYLEIMRLLISDPRVDPSADNNMPLEQAIRGHKTEMVKILLECPSVSRNIEPRILEVARLFNNPEVISLLN